MTDSCLDSPSAEALSAEKLSSYWMPFTANRDFKQSPRLINGAQGHSIPALMAVNSMMLFPVCGRQG